MIGTRFQMLLYNIVRQSKEKVCLHKHIFSVIQYSSENCNKFVRDSGSQLLREPLSFSHANDSRSLRQQMGKFAALYSFPERVFSMAIRRLQRLRSVNPGVAFFPMVGPVQFFYFPMVIDPYMFGSKGLARRFPGSNISHAVNWLASSAPGVFRLSMAINKNIIALAKNNKLNEMCTSARAIQIQGRLSKNVVNAGILPCSEREKFMYAINPLQ